MKVCIPSKGRSGKTTTQTIMQDGAFYVPESEVAAYSMHCGEVIGVPDEVKGITATRNWILKNTDDRWIVFIDDDVEAQGWIKLYSHNARPKRMDQAEWLNEFVKLFDLTEELSWKVWGVSTDGAPRSVYPYRPFIFQSYVTASCMGIVNDGTYYFDENYPVKEDYEICLRHIRDYGGVLACRYLFWRNSHWKDDGGCKSYRTQSMEAKAIKDLIQAYPGLIKRITRGGSEYSIELNF